jgi:hypothetical protein
LAGAAGEEPGEDQGGEEGGAEHNGRGAARAGLPGDSEGGTCFGRERVAAPSLLGSGPKLRCLGRLRRD